MVEEQHVSQYGSLMDVHQGWLEGLLMHQYNRVLPLLVVRTDRNLPEDAQCLAAAA